MKRFHPPCCLFQRPCKWKRSRPAVRSVEELSMALGAEHGELSMAYSSRLSPLLHCLSLSLSLSVSLVPFSCRCTICPHDILAATPENRLRTLISLTKYCHWAPKKKRKKSRASLPVTVISMEWYRWYMWSSCSAATEESSGLVSPSLGVLIVSNPIRFFPS
jgi:hypothetical protein